MSPNAARRPEQSQVLRIFSAPYAAPDEELAAALLAQAPREAAAEARIDARATRLIEAIREKSGGLGGIEDFLREYSLSTREGLALMVLAEALLRVPDAATADRLIEDELSSGDWTHHETKSSALLVSASAWALGISARIIQPAETPENILESLGKRLGLPALHPRDEASSHERVLRELTPRVLELARQAKAHDLNFTVDAEEADRLELSLDLTGLVLADPSLAGWDGFGLAIQAYQKRAGAVIDWARDLSAALGRRMMVRLVKGAYWDTEVKRAQERGLADYPVFTRKAMTDLSYLDCVRKLLAARPQLYPQFATHNALTVAGVIEEADGVEGYEFQRLHGMGEALYDALLEDEPGAACRVYAPVGGHRDLLAYLVRRLLENGANSSFVSVAADSSVPVSEILRRPQAWLADASPARQPRIP